jgi:hypothetical protein
MRIEKLFAACAEKFRSDEGIFLVESIQECVAITDVQRRIPDYLPFFFGAFDQTRLSRRLAKSDGPGEKFKNE